MSQPKVSVIIPVYNAEQYLRDCLECVTGQTLQEIEIVCVDDGSTDGSPAILQEYASADTRIKVLTQPNSGSGIARNNGIRAAAGEYVVFMDSDDGYPEKETLEKLYSAASFNGAMICGGSFSSFNDNGVLQTKFAPRKLWGYTFKEDGEVLYEDYQFDYGYHRFLYKRDFLLDHDLLFPSYYRFQDPPFFVRAMICAGKFYAIHDVTYRYRNHPTNIAASKIKTRDLILGLTDDLIMAKENNLNRLYKLTVERCCEDYWKTLRAAEGFADEEIQHALKNLNQAVDLCLLKTNSCSDIDKLYTWRNNATKPQQDLSSNANSLSLAQQELKSIKNSRSFRIGRAITWLPRMIRGWVRCCREKGLKYALKRTKERMRGRK